MILFLLLLLLFACVAIIIWGVIRRDRLIQLPVLIAFVYIGWVIPQILGLMYSDQIPENSLEKTTFLALLCIISVFLGYTSKKNSTKLFLWQYNRTRLLVGAVLLNVIGAFFFIKVGQLEASVNASTGGLWQGVITIYIFFARMLFVGFAIAFVLLIQKFSYTTLALVLFGGAFFLQRAIIYGRRAAMAEIFVIILLGLWYNKRWLPSSGVIISCFLGGILIVNSMGDYRNLVLNDTGSGWSGAGFFEVIGNIDFVDNLKSIVIGAKESYEMKNAAFNISAIEQMLAFDYGASLWNNIVESYIPGQLIGYQNKSSIMIDMQNVAKVKYGYIPHTGTTLTGFTDSFRSFWYFGAVKFFIIAFIVNKWHRAANNNHVGAQVIVMLTIVPALHAVTHSTHEFFTSFIQLGLFLVPVLILSKYRTSTSSS